MHPAESIAARNDRRRKNLRKSARPRSIERAGVLAGRQDRALRAAAARPVLTPAARTDLCICGRDEGSLRHGRTELNLTLMRLIDEQHMRTPYYGARQMARHLRLEGYVVGRKRVRRLMQKMGLCVIYQRPRTTIPATDDAVYPYLLRDLVIDRPNQVWCADITYIPMRRGFLYLVAIMDWARRKVLAWRLSNTMDT